MATCPRCLGTLTEDHHCPHGVFQRLFRALSTFLVGAVVGGLAPFVVLDGRPAPALLLASAALGAVLSGALRQAIEGPRR